MSTMFSERFALIVDGVKIGLYDADKETEAKREYASYTSGGQIYCTSAKLIDRQTGKSVCEYRKPRQERATGNKIGRGRKAA